jgi:hypothetical protein
MSNEKLLDQCQQAEGRVDKVWPVGEIRSGPQRLPAFSIQPLPVVYKNISLNGGLARFVFPKTHIYEVHLLCLTGDWRKLHSEKLHSCTIHQISIGCSNGGG